MSFLNRLLPPALQKEDDSLVRARTLVIFSLANIAFAFPFFLFHLLHGQSIGLAISCAFVLLNLVGGIGLQWWSRSTRIPAHFACGVLVSMSLLASLAMGGIHSPSMAWLVSAPAFASLLLGKWEARLWGLIALGLILLLALLHHGQGIGAPPSEEAIRSFHSGNLLHLAVALLSTCLIPLLVRLGGAGQRSSQLISCQLTAAAIFAVSLLNGGAHSPALIPWLASIPLYLLVLCPDWVAKVWSSCCILFLLAFGILSVLHPNFSLRLDVAWIERASGSLYLSGLLLLSLVGVLFEMRRRKTVREMQETLRALHIAHNQLIHLHKEKDEFLSIVTHDLKSPLTTITGYTEMIVEDMAGSPEDVKEWCGQILLSTKQMMTLITNLLNTHSIESGMARFHCESIDLVRIAAEAADSHVIGARKKRLEIVREIPDAPHCVHADAQAAHHILNNLISNAVKYSPKGASPIRIRVCEEEDFCRTEVCDGGPGISRDDQTRLFQKYTRLTARPTNGESSTGLGLSIAKQMTEKMGGTLVVESHLGHGSTFILRLPKKKQPMPQENDAILPGV